MPAEKMVIRELNTGIVHYGDLTIEHAGTEALFGVEHTDIITIGPNSITHIALVNVAISHAETAPAGSINHYE